MSPHAFVPLALLLGLSACTQALETPTATIEIVGDGQNLPGEPFVLDGSGSSDPNELSWPLAYSWRLLAAPAGSLAAFNAVDLPVVALVPDAYGEYVVGLQVSNGLLWSEQATATLQVEACGNEAPAIEGLAADPADPLTGDVVQLSATWNDADLDDCGLEQAVTWDWSLDALPAGSTASLNDPGASNPWFTADVPGDYGIGLVLTDDTGRTSDEGTLVVTVSECGSAAPSVTGVVATPVDPDVGEQVVLSVSVDDADNGESCGLSQDLEVTTAFVGRPAGSTASLAPAEGTTPAFVADVPGTYTLRTTVTDDTGLHGSVDTEVEIGACGTAAPAIDGITVAPGAPNVGSLVALDVTWTDDDNDGAGCGLDQAVEVHTWFVSRPAGSAAALVPAVGDTPAFVADVSGDYLLRTQVLDETGRTAHQDTAITVDACGEAAPTIALDAVSSATPATGEPVAVSWDVADTDIDTCGLDQVLTVTTAVVQAPAGATATLDPASGTAVGFTPDVPGAYTLRATVTDGTGRSATAETVVTAGACGDAAPTITLGSVSSATPDTGEPVSLTWTINDTDNAPGGCNLGQTLTVATALVQAPAGSAAALSPSTGTTVGFTPNVPGSYTLRATVADGTGRTATAETVVTADSCGSADPTIALGAQAPADPITGEGVSVSWTVDDPDNGGGCSLGQTLSVVTALVEAPAGSAVALSPAAGPTVGFTPDRDGNYTLRATVSDGTGRGATLERVVSVDVCGNRPPDAQIEMITPVQAGPDDDLTGPDAVLVEDDVVVQLSAAASTNPDSGCDPTASLATTWWFVALPAGSGVSFNDATLVIPSFTPDVPGTYEVMLAVDDGTYTDLAAIEIEVDPSLLIQVAAGFSIEYLAGGSGLWDGPQGLTVDGAGNIYVAQTGGDRVTVTTPSGRTTRTFSQGGWITEPIDLVYDPVSTDLFLVVDDSGNLYDRVIRLAASGQQTAWTAADQVDEPKGIALDPTTREIVVADNDGGSDEVRFYDADDSAIASSQGTNNFGGQLDNPWGVAIAGTSRWAVNQGNGELWRWTASNDEERLANGFDDPRDLARAPSGNLVFADPPVGALYHVTDCGSPPCTVTLLAWGPWSPAGVTFDAAGDLLVTDLDGDLLYVMSGPF